MEAECQTLANIVQRPPVSRRLRLIVTWIRLRDRLWFPRRLPETTYRYD